MIDYTDAESGIIDSLVHDGIERLVTAGPGDPADKFVTVPMFPDSTFTIRRPTPHATIRAALILRNKIAIALDGAVRDARGEGTPWSEIAVQLDIPADPDEYGNSAAYNVFREIAGPPSRPFDTLSVTWRCRTCNQFVKDLGPDTSDPVVTESGHADDCARHLAEIAAYERRLGLLEQAVVDRVPSLLSVDDEQEDDWPLPPIDRNDPVFADLTPVLDGDNPDAAALAAALLSRLMPSVVVAVVTSPAWPDLVVAARECADDITSDLPFLVDHLAGQYLARASRDPDPAACLAQGIAAM